MQINQLTSKLFYITSILDNIILNMPIRINSQLTFDPRFGFVGGGVSSGQFVIEEITGVIRLHNKAISLDRDKYELNVTAMDDGSCCVNGESTIHTSTAVVVVFITDVNDNKPIFKDCGTYYPKVEEGAQNGSPVIKVKTQH